MFIIRSMWLWLFGDPSETNRYRMNASDRFAHFLHDHRGWFCFCVYLAIGFYTFGYDATHYPEHETVYISDSANPPLPPVDNFKTGFKAVIAGTMWPLFWTWEKMS